MGNTVERAFELARSGECRNVAEIERQLKAEGFDGVAQHLQGAAIKKQLRELCQASARDRAQTV
jgi:chitinase